MALYEVLEDGTIVPKAGHTVGNLNCLRTEVVYDKDISDSSINWGYTSGIQGGITVSGKDFSRYAQLKIYINSTSINFIYEMDLTTPANRYVATLDGFPYYAGDSVTTSDTPQNDLRSISAVSTDKTKFYHYIIGYNNGTTFTDRTNNQYYYVYRIEGILKEPAMIYTGKELFAGSGINIEDGMVSANGMTLVYTNNNVSAGFAGQTLSLDLSKYNFVAIYCCARNSVTTPNLCLVAPVGNNNALLMRNSYWDDQDSKMRQTARPVTSITKTGITFGASYFDGSTSSSLNGCIPKYIFAM